MCIYLSTISFEQYSLAILSNLLVWSAELSMAQATQSHEGVELAADPEHQPLRNAETSAPTWSHMKPLFIGYLVASIVGICPMALIFPLLTVAPSSLGIVASRYDTEKERKQPKQRKPDKGEELGKGNEHHFLSFPPCCSGNVSNCVVRSSYLRTVELAFALSAASFISHWLLYFLSLALSLTIRHVLPSFSPPSSHHLKMLSLGNNGAQNCSRLQEPLHCPVGAFPSLLGLDIWCLVRYNCVTVATSPSHPSSRPIWYQHAMTYRTKEYQGDDNEQDGCVHIFAPPACSIINESPLEGPRESKGKSHSINIRHAIQKKHTHAYNQKGKSSSR